MLLVILLYFADDDVQILLRGATPRTRPVGLFLLSLFLITLTQVGHESFIIDLRLNTLLLKVSAAASTRRLVEGRQVSWRLAL